MPEHDSSFEDRIDPEIAAELARMPPRDLGDIASARASRDLLTATMHAARPANPDVLREDFAVMVLGAPDVRVRLYRPRTAVAALPCLLWMHGGGHVLGSLDQDDFLVEEIVSAVGCAVASVDWRRAPENPFPAAVDDCYASLSWVFANAARLGCDSERIAIGGASSGGGLAAGTALRARDQGGPRLALQLLVYPMLDDRNVTPSSYMVHHPQLWTRRANLMAWTAYLGAAAGSPDVAAYAAPARAASLARLPPAFIATGELDLFVDEDIEYAQRLGQAGVPFELHVYRGAVHGFDLVAPDGRLAQQFRRDRDSALCRAFS